MQLAVFTVFFGPLPPWLSLTLLSMEHNSGVKFIVIGDAPAPMDLPPNVRFEQVSFAAMQGKLTALLHAHNRSNDVKYSAHYKANDIKPLAPALYPHLLRGYDWWAWADLDVIFGDLLKFMGYAVRRPACCKVPLRRDGTSSRPYSPVPVLPLKYPLAPPLLPLTRGLSDE